MGSHLSTAWHPCIHRLCVKLRVHAGEGVGEEAEAEAAEGGAGVTEKTAATDCNAGRNCFWCQKDAAAPFPNSWEL